MASVRVVRAGGGALRCASRLFMRASAWLLIQVCARKTASNPNRTAKPIMTKVLVRTRLPLNDARNSCFVAVTIDPPVVWNW